MSAYAVCSNPGFPVTEFIMIKKRNGKAGTGGPGCTDDGKWRHGRLPVPAGKS